jgi:hypothetical protein
MSRLSNNGITDYELKHYTRIILSKYGELRVKDISSKLLEDYGFTVTGSRITHTIHGEPTITRRSIRVPSTRNSKRSGTHLAYLYGITSTTEELVEVSVTFMLPTLNTESSKADLCAKLVEAGLRDFRIE